MSLMTYEDARPWARAIKTRVAAREMPPWHIDRNIGIQKFKDDPSLSDEEIATIVKWVDSGAPRGNPADMPPRACSSPTRAQWQIGKPDLVVKFPATRCRRPVLICSAISTRTFRLEEDRYIKAIQTRPVGARRRARSCITRCRIAVTIRTQIAESMATTARRLDGGQFLVEYASGKNAEVYPDDSGVLLQAGKKADGRAITSTRSAKR